MQKRGRRPRIRREDTAMTRIALYPGSFDPVTNGHVDVLRQALDLADRVVVAIGVSATKTPLFGFDERAAMIREAAAGAADRVEVVSFSGLVVTIAAEVGATVMVRGLRDGTDLDFEMQLAGMNATLAPAVRTVFVPSSPGLRHITATLVRQVAQLGGDVSGFVPEGVARRLAARYRG
jgi:pantetheine-phosphate adenylyltransferase